MKTTNKITLVSLIGGVALIGSAFAAWQFNASTSTSAISNVEITKETSVGHLADVATFYLTLDQKGAYWTNVSYDNSEANIENNTIVTSFAVTYNGSEESNDVSDVTLEVTYTVDSEIEEYVTFTGGELVNVTSNNNVKSATYNLPTLAYTASKPTTSAEYAAMKTALAGKKVSFTISATVA